MCPNLLKLGECPRGTKCTYAHSEEEKELYRSLSTKSKSKPRSGEVLQSPKPTVVPASVVTGSISGDLPSNGSPYSSLGSVQGPGGTTGPAALDYSESALLGGVRIGDLEVHFVLAAYLLDAHSSS